MESGTGILDYEALETEALELETDDLKPELVIRIRSAELTWIRNEAFGVGQWNHGMICKAFVLFRRQDFLDANLTPNSAVSFSKDRSG